MVLGSWQTMQEPGRAVTGAVITVQPSMIPEANEGCRSGLEVMQILNEPTAASLLTVGAARNHPEVFDLTWWRTLMYRFWKSAMGLRSNPPVEILSWVGMI